MVSVEDEDDDERKKKEGEIPLTSLTVLQLLLLSYRYNRQETALLPLQSTLHDNNIIFSILI